MEMFDTHAHLNWREDYKDDIDDVLANAANAGVTHIMLASSTIEDSEISLELRKMKSDRGVKLSCMVGVHPETAETFDEEAKEKLEDWLRRKDELGIVAVGEIGMDYHYEDCSPAHEAAAFIYQMGLAYRYDLPAVIHERDACAGAEGPEIEEEHHVEEHAALQLHKAVIGHGSRELLCQMDLDEVHVEVLEVAECAKVVQQQDSHDLAVRHVCLAVAPAHAVTAQNRLF